jgi:hypothetical protein
MNAASIPTLAIMGMALLVLTRANAGAIPARGEY